MNQSVKNRTKERKLSAIMFSDIVGYSAMIGTDEQKGLELLERNKEIHRELIKKNKGVLLKDIGDAILSSFPSAYNAVTCAVEIQQAVEAIPNLRLRIGIHVGDVVFQDDDVFGDGVNIAARIQNVANPGCICVSERVQADIRNKPEIESKFIGTRKLKNIDSPIAVYSIEYPGFSGTHPIDTAQKQFKFRRTIGIISLLLIIMAIAWYATTLRKSDAKKTPMGTEEPLTTTRVGIKIDVTWSPDGSLFAYGFHNGENFNIQWSSKEGGNTISLTNEPTDEILPRWSPEGSKISYLSDRGSGLDLFWRPASGGPERKIAETNLHMLEHFGEMLFSVGAMPWSADGNRFIFPRLGNSGEISLWEADLVSGNEKQLTFPEPGGIDLWGSRSFDEQQIVFMRNGNLWLITTEGKEVPLLEDEYANIQPTWAKDPDVVIFSSSRGKGAFSQIWQMSISSGALEQLTYGENHKLAPVVNKQGILSYQHFTHTTDLFSVNMDGMQTTQLTFYNGDNFHPRISPDGEKLVYQSARKGNYEIWLLDLTSNEEIKLTDQNGLDIKPDWSPDGKEIVFLSQQNGEWQLLKFRLENRKIERLTKRAIRQPNFIYDYALNVRWSPDGKSIGYLAHGDKGRSLWIVDSNGENQRVAIESIHSFDWYRGSDMVVYNKIAKSRSEKSELRIRNLVTGSDTLLYNERLTEIFVKADGAGIGFIHGPGHWNMDVYLLPLQPPSQETEFPIPMGKPMQLTNGEGKWHAHNCAWSPDGSRMIYVRDEDVCNIYELTGRRF